MAPSPTRSDHRKGPQRLWVKVCGITSVEDALLAADCGADAVGMVFWPRSPRAVDVETARDIASALPPFVTRVGVFVDAGADETRRTADAVGLDVLQLHGNEQAGETADVGRRVMKAIRIGNAVPEQALRAWVERGAAILLDTAVRGGLPGGTGQAFDWSLARAARELAPQLILAGGLTPATLADAVAAVSPDGVDVSSGVEARPGRKDPAALRAFLEAVQQIEGGRRAPAPAGGER
jgi:phosphoribosylanthranilate isomerase